MKKFVTWVIVLSCIVLAGYFGITTDLDRTPILETATAQKTEEFLSVAENSLKDQPANEGPVQVGWASASITPPVGTPTYGYSSRLRKGITAISDSVYVHALAIKIGNGTPLVFLTADICLWVDTISDSIRSGVAALLPRERIYFGASHTHSGPGGYAMGPLDAFIMGRNDSSCRRLIVQSIDVICRSLNNLQPGGYRELSIDAPEFIMNREQEPDPVDGQLLVAEYRQSNGHRCALVSYGAHATCINGIATVYSGNYPGALCRSLKFHGYDDALFFAGATGQAGPALNGVSVFSSNIEPAWHFGSLLADTILRYSSLSTIPFSREATLTVLYSEIALPEISFPLLRRTMSPFLNRFLLTTESPRAFIQAVKLGSSIYINHSFEVSSVAAVQLKQFARERGGTLYLTSFNGYHNLYMLPNEYYDHNGYESKTTLFGPHLGSYLSYVTRRVFSILNDKK